MTPRIHAGAFDAPGTQLLVPRTQVPGTAMKSNAFLCPKATRNRLTSRLQDRQRRSTGKQTNAHVPPWRCQLWRSQPSTTFAKVCRMGKRKPAACNLLSGSPGDVNLLSVRAHTLESSTVGRIPSFRAILRQTDLAACQSASDSAKAVGGRSKRKSQCLFAQPDSVPLALQRRHPSPAPAIDVC